MRALLTHSPFSRIPKVLLQALANYATFYLNSVPDLAGVSKTLSPAYIVEGIRLNYQRHCQLEFLEYVHVHNISENNMNPRTSPALNLGPTGNLQGSHMFYNIPPCFSKISTSFLTILMKSSLLVLSFCLIDIILSN